MSVTGVEQVDCELLEQTMGERDNVWRVRLIFLKSS